MIEAKKYVNEQLREFHPAGYGTQAWISVRHDTPIPCWTVHVDRLGSCD